MEDFLELEDVAQPENLDHKLQKKLDDHQHTSESDLKTSPKASIDRQHPPDIDRYPPGCIYRHQPDDIDRHPGLDEPSGYIRPPIWTEEAVGFHKRVKRIHDHVKIVVPCAVFEAESPIPHDRSMKISSYIEVLDDYQHVEAFQRGLRFRDEVDNGPAEASSIDTDRIPSNNTNKPASIDATTFPSIDTGRVSEQKEFDVCGNLRDGDTTTRSDKSGGKKRRNWKKGKMIKDGPRVSLIPRFSDGVTKSRTWAISRLRSNGLSACFTVDRCQDVNIDRLFLFNIDRWSSSMVIWGAYSKYLQIAPKSSLSSKSLPIQ
ncbi:hypothetical protein F2Q69_00014064 [Brassica cretica]|uniref:Uncharacterized protein n=1 Tax=Brassica cretica TaxID=69181 RepID=A0A8S9QY39_BRACR|nr:hypothetical protein F2Q69_00014064 [Brassica cretica]